MLASWLECIPDLPDTIKKYYYLGAFLRDVTSEPSVKDLYQQVVEVIIPLQKELPIAFYPQEPNQSDSFYDSSANIHM